MKTKIKDLLQVNNLNMLFEIYIDYIIEYILNMYKSYSSLWLLIR